MNNFWIYLLKSGLALWLFYGIYWFFLRKETFFSLNRFMLLGSLIVSLTLPFLRIENLFILNSQQAIPSFFMDFGDDIRPSSSPGTTVGLIRLRTVVPLMMLAVYLSGVVFLGWRLIYQMTRLFMLRNNYSFHRKDGMRLIYVDEEIAPCSFFKQIFINRSAGSGEDLEKIILHEKAHMTYLHFIDLILVGLTGILHWFNPVMWLYERSVREIHEYEADREVLKSATDRGRYQALLVNQVTGIEIFRLANSFSKSITKKRIIMMTKIKSNNLSAAKVLLMLPVFLCLVFAFSKPQIITESSQVLQPKQVSGKVTDAQSGDPLCCAAVIIEGTTEGTTVDKNGNYKLEIPGVDPVLVFSHVGYETQRIKADRTEINVKMQKKVYEIPEGQGTKIKDERVAKPDEEIFFIVEEMPSFQGKTAEAFREYLQQNLIYPEEAKEKQITGKVYVQMTVNSKGEVVDVIVVRSANPLLNKEAVRVVESSPLWEPGKQGGKPVAVNFTFPVEFKLSEK